MQLNKYSSYCNWHKQSTTGIVQFIDMDYILLSNSLWWKCNLCKLSLLSLLLICLLFIKKKLKIIKDYQAKSIRHKKCWRCSAGYRRLKIILIQWIVFLSVSIWLSSTPCRRCLHRHRGIHLVLNYWVLERFSTGCSVPEISAVIVVPVRGVVLGLGLTPGVGPGYRLLVAV